VILNWAIARGVVPIPRSTLEFQSENIDIYDFELSDREVAQIASLNTDLRICNKEEHVGGYNFFA